MAQRRRKATSGNTRTYILELKNGDTRKVTFPDHWRLTFGNVLPYQGKEQRNAVEHRIALRIYGDSKEDLRGVMLDVVSFRDSSMGVLEKRTSVQRKGGTLRTEHGSKDVVYEARMTEWVDPDKEDGSSSGAEQFKALSARKDILGDGEDE
jgi:paraquat-inducible protein B